MILVVLLLVVLPFPEMRCEDARTEQLALPAPPSVELASGLGLRAWGLGFRV